MCYIVYSKFRVSVCCNATSAHFVELLDELEDGMQEGISIFIGDVPRASEFDAVASRIGLGSTEEDDKALASLQSLAQDVAEAEGWNRYALGLYEAYRHLQAADIFRQILATGESDAYRLNLAAAYSQVAFIDLCRHELRTVAEKGANEELRRLAGQQLSKYEEFVGLDVDTQRLRGLQLAALERQVEASDAALDQLLRLAGLLLAQARAVGDESMTERGRVVLEKAAVRFPLSEEVVQYLVQIYIGSDDDAPLSRLLETVRRRDPRSSLLRLIESYSEGPVASMFTVRADALARVGQESPDLSEAASSDLARLVATHPGNSWIRLQHAWLLLVRRNEALAAEHARRLRKISGREHAFHFNLGQLLWLTGDAEAGRYHLDLSIARASTREEVDDARNFMRQFSGVRR